jgi:Rps23 Pro-64 3,4-dihydroxylase Tpa1-like proline 4-hydroxylase
MKARLVKHPVEHIVIEDFLNEEDLIEVERELYNLYHAMFEGEYNDGKGSRVIEEFKKCLNLNLHAHYGDQIDLSYLEQTVINKRLFSEEMREFYDSCGSSSSFSLMNDTDSSYSLLAGFRDGDYYKWHGDLGIVTTNVMISRNPSFTGGDFILSNQVKRPNSDRVIGEKLETIKYPYKKGTAILFPSRFKHCVTKVKTIDNKIENVRFTLQNRCWVNNI